MVIDADTFALFSAPLFGVLAVSDVVRVLDATLVLEAPHITSLAVWNLYARVFAAAHVILRSTLAATTSAPDLIAITVGDDTLLSALRPFPFVAAVDLLAAGRFPAIIEASIAHAAVAVLGPPHLVWAVVYIVGIDGA